MAVSSHLTKEMVELLGGPDLIKELIPDVLEGAIKQSPCREHCAVQALHKLIGAGLANAET